VLVVYKHIIHFEAKNFAGFAEFCMIAKNSHAKINTQVIANYGN